MVIRPTHTHTQAPYINTHTRAGLASFAQQQFPNAISVQQTCRRRCVGDESRSIAHCMNNFERDIGSRCRHVGYESHSVAYCSHSAIYFKWTLPLFSQSPSFFGYFPLLGGVCVGSRCRHVGYESHSVYMCSVCGLLGNTGGQHGMSNPAHLTFLQLNLM
jgi:hypothetical protein